MNISELIQDYSPEENPLTSLELNMDKPSELLKAAKRLIEKQSNWTQKAYARNDEDIPIDSDSPNAVCFCSLGALHKTLGKYDKTFNYKYQQLFDAAYGYLDKAIELVGAKDLAPTISVASYNDTYSHSEVMAVWDKAIELAEKAGD